MSKEDRKIANTRAYKDVAIMAALKSGAMIKSSVGKIKKISYKGRINIVTDVDKRSEEVIIRIIQKHFPEHSILSEERPPKDTGSRFRWVIDPIDGTTNFAHGFPFFCVSIALEFDGESVVGVVYDPVRDELFTAVKGRGAYLNGKRIAVSNINRLDQGLLMTGFAYGIANTRNTNLNNFKKFLMRAQAIRRAGSAALDMCYVACGRIDGFWEMDLKPWDSAAAYLVVKESKGTVTKFDGSSFTPYDRCVVASNGKIHQKMIKVLNIK